MLKPYGIRLAAKPKCSLRSILCKVKDPVLAEDRNSVVYKVGCLDCTSSYIGETGRQLHTRITEHQRNVQNNYANSQIAQHVYEHNHNINWHATSILTQHTDNRSRKILEAFHTNTTNNTLNRAIDIPTQYTHIASAVLGTHR